MLKVKVTEGRSTKPDDANKRIRNRVRDAIRRGTKKIESGANPRIHKVTGQTENSSRRTLRVGKNFVGGQVGYDLFVSRFLHDGTKKTKSYPFLLTEAEADEDAIVNDIMDSICAAIDESAV